jgi:subtilase family serine protease
MQMFRSPVRWAAALTLAVGLTVPLMLASSSSGAAARPGHLRALSGSRARTSDRVLGDYSAPHMSVDVVLTPRHQRGLQNELKAVYTRHSGSFHHWLRRGQFATRFGPTAKERGAVASYLRAQGMAVSRGSSPFLLRAVGSSQRVESAFHTSLRTYSSSAPATKGRPAVTHYFANSQPVRLPASVSGHVLSVVGLTNTVRMHSSDLRTMGHKSMGHKSTGQSVPTPPSCETPYPTEQQLANAILGISGFPFGYGDGPGCNGLTPSQVRSIYGAPSNKHTFGRGATLGLFELSAYQPSDINTWAQTFFGSSYQAPLQDVNVDGGPLNPQCPVGDQCPPAFNGYSGDIEVDADIEATLDVAPSIAKLQVYNAPNDFTGQTELDEYTQIAQDDTSSTISSSWGLCENDAGAAYAQAENLIFEQMALQGQSLFNAAGDTGAFDCIRSDNTNGLNVMDPASQPWVTSVGGTSFASFNPGGNQNPGYPASGESVWNAYNLCSPGPGSDGLTGFQWCAGDGAGGGGSSQFWGRPFYQVGRGVNNPDTVFGNGTTQCSLAPVGTPCREVPDVSANADENTPYAEFCTGSTATPFSTCGTFSGNQNPPGWFGIGGTSLSSPVWSAIIGDRNGFHGRRTGNANVFFYSHYLLTGYRDFHDVTPLTGQGQSATNNGFYSTRPGFDLATGIGTPKIAKVIEGR